MFLLVILLMYGLTVLVPSLNISVPFVEVVVGGLMTSNPSKPTFHTDRSRLFKDRFAKWGISAGGVSRHRFERFGFA